MKLAIYGALGRMGILIGKLAEDFGYEIVSAVENAESGNVGKNYFEQLFGKPGEIVVTSEIANAPEVIFDFTLPVAFDSLLSQCLKLSVPLLTGTTGLSETQIQALHDVGNNIPVMYSTNYSLGVAVVRRLTKQAAKILYSAGFDIEIIEAHHRKKVDAPSGTALSIGESAALGAGLNFSENAVFARQGHTGERKHAEIGFSAVRGGTIPGEHTVMFAGENEIVEISHHAQNREIFARGALAAAKWLITQPPGFYTFDDYMESII
ncbi:MAG: 4-hydroxy-tetrahydrodipicolinate reductase [Planctomycetes bacterium]|nr:4-hydroxy-tetrahydrodipicolinate reductase [Planctomycetota bacterium]